MTQFLDTKLSCVNGIYKTIVHRADSYIIPLNLLKEQKSFILIEIPICNRNENTSNKLIRKSSSIY